MSLMKTKRNKRKKIMLQDYTISSSDMQERVPHLILEKSHETDEDYFKLSQTMSSPYTYLVHFCDKKNVVMTGIGSKGGFLDPDVPVSYEAVETALKPYIKKGSYFLVTYKSKADASCKGKRVAVSYPLVMWVCKRDLNDDSETTECVNIDHGEHLNWFSILAPSIYKVLGRGAAGMMDFILGTIAVDHSFKSFRANKLAFRIRDDSGEKVAQVEACVKNLPMQETILARQLHIGGQKCDGVECGYLPIDSRAFHDEAWLRQDVL